MPGVESIACDLLDRAQVARLPECPERALSRGPEVRIVGQSGTDVGDEHGGAGDRRGDDSARAGWWRSPPAMSTRCARRGAADRGRATRRRRSASTRNPASGGSAIFEYFANQHGLRCLLFRLNYAVDLRYGVLVDIARKVYAGEPVDLTVPAFNVIWQRDANSYALRSLEHCAAPPRVLNVTGRGDTVGARRRRSSSRARFARPCRFRGAPGPAGAVERRVGRGKL